jgi:hypothetical protein
MVALPFIALATSVLGTAYAAYSSYQQGKAVQRQANYNSDAAVVNQVTTQKQADSDVSKIREKYRRVRGSQRAAAAASGLQTDGSLSDLFLDTNIQEDMDVLTTLYQAKTQIVGQENKKNLSLMQGDQAMQGAKLAATGSLLSGAGNIISSWPTLKNDFTTKYPTLAG